METITSIIDTTFSTSEAQWATTYDGFIVTTDKQQIKLGIDNQGQCCESWGHFMTNDNIEEFVGAKLLSIDIVNECLEKDKAPDLYEGGVMFVNIETSSGTLQFTAYNDHNGYYGHEAVVISEQLNHSETL